MLGLIDEWMEGCERAKEKEKEGDENEKILTEKNIINGESESKQNSTSNKKLITTRES